MQAGRRKIREDAGRFEGLIAKGTGRAEHIRDYPTTDDTVRFMLKDYRDYAWQVRKLAPKLKGADLESTCRNIFNFCYVHFQYKLDPHGTEQVKTPAGSWRLRKEGIDCDCFSYLIMCILDSLRITFKVRRVDFGSGWQHVYIIVPKRAGISTAERGNYYVIDPVTDTFDHEPGHDKPVIVEGVKYYARKHKDNLEMARTLERLDGIDTISIGDAEMGNIFKKIGKGIKKGVQAVGKGLKKAGQTVIKGVDKTIELVNRYVNPATIALRNGFLLAMKINLLNVSKRIRFAYWDDATAIRNGWSPSEFDKLKKARKRMEDIYEQAGGKAENLRKGIINGKGNNDGKVSKSLGSLGAIGEIEQYADEQEWQILNEDPTRLAKEIIPNGGLLPIHVEGNNGEIIKLTGMEGNLGSLGEAVSASALIAAGTAAVGAIAALISAIKGPREAQMQEQSFEATDGIGVPAEYAGYAYPAGSPAPNARTGTGGGGNEEDGGSLLMPIALGGALIFAAVKLTEKPKKRKAKTLSGFEFDPEEITYPQEID